LLDERTGRLIYQFVSPNLADFDPKSKGITGEGEIFINLRSSYFEVTSSPNINLGATIPEARAWPVPDRLAQYLMQKLIGPTIEDERFMTQELQL
jgi:hypothetical protein